jgi:hypothetical protein
MNLHPIRSLTAGVIALCLTSTNAYAGGENHYQVTITNVTAGIAFTPLLVVTHKKGHPLFTLGEPASPELTRIAEGGDTMPMQEKLLNSGMAYDAASSGGLLGPGESVTVSVKSKGGYKYVSVVGMLLPTNDGVVALNGMRLPKQHAMVMTPGYDGGTEINDELCANIPGPHCGGAAFSDEDGEGYVHIHRGIHGVGDLSANEHDWRNPIAKISLKRVD